MGVQRILFVTSDTACLLLRRGRRLSEQVCFPAGTTDGLDALLAEAPGIPTWILVDLAEEDFRVEQVVRAHGRDRTALLKRHAQRLFRATPYRHHRVLGRSSQQRHKIDVLFSALINPERIEPWLDTLERHAVPLPGICSVAHLSAGLLRPLHCRRGEVLLVSHQRGAGLRQSFFRDGKLIFSRLSKLKDHLSAADYVAALDAEITHTQRYLHNLRLLERGRTLKVRLLSGGIMLAALKSGLHGGSDRDYGLFDLADVARRLGCPEAPDGHFAEALFACLLSRGGQANHYALPGHRRHHVTARLRRGLEFASAGLAAGALLASGINLADGLVYQRQTEDLVPLVTSAEARHQAALAAIPRVAYSAQEIEGAVMLADTLEHRRRLPQALLGRLGRTLLNEPGVRLDRVDWYLADDPETPPPGGDNGETADLQEEAEAGTGAERAGGRYEVAVLDGRLLPFDGNYRKAHDRVRQVGERLARLPGVVRVETLAWPLNTDPGTSVSGGVGGNDREPEARFRLRVVTGASHERL